MGCILTFEMIQKGDDSAEILNFLILLYRGLLYNNYQFLVSIHSLIFMQPVQGRVPLPATTVPLCFESAKWDWSPNKTTKIVNELLKLGRAQYLTLHERISLARKLSLLMGYLKINSLKSELFETRQWCIRANETF